MNALGPPKKAPGAGKQTGRKLTASKAQYAALVLLTKIFGAVFWFFEQRRGRFADLLENERSRQ